MESPIIYTEDDAPIHSLLCVASGANLGPVASIELDTKDHIEAVLGLYMCDNTMFTSFASLVSLTAIAGVNTGVTGRVSLTAVVDANMSVPDDPNLRAGLEEVAKAEADSNFDFFGFGSDFQPQSRPGCPKAEDSISKAAIEKYTFLAGPLTAALELGDDSNLVLDAAMSGSADSIFSADEDTPDLGVAGSTEPACSADADEPTSPVEIVTDLLHSPTSVDSRDTALYTPYTAPQLHSVSKDTTSTAAHPGNRVFLSQKAISVDTDQRNMDATVAFEMWRHACLALAAFQSPLVTASPSISKPLETFSEGDTTRPLSALRDTAVDTTPFMLPTQIEPVSNPDALRGNKRSKLLAAISSVSAASTVSISFHSIQTQMPNKGTSTELNQSFASALSTSSLDQDSVYDPSYDCDYGYKIMPSFAAIMSVFVSCTPTLPAPDAFASIPSSPLLTASLSAGDHSTPVCSIESVEKLSCLMSTVGEHAGRVALPSLLSARPKALDAATSRDRHSSSLPTHEEIQRPRQPLMLSFPSIQLAKRRLGTIQEVPLSDGLPSSLSCLLSTSPSAALNIVLSESVVFVTNPPSASPYSPHSFVFESVNFDQFPDACLRLEPPGDFSSSLSTEYGCEIAQGLHLLPPLPPLAVSAFPCHSPRVSRSQSAFRWMFGSFSRMINPRPVLSTAETTRPGFTSGSLTSNICNVNIERPSNPERFSFKKVIQRLKAFF